MHRILALHPWLLQPAAAAGERRSAEIYALLRRHGAVDLHMSGTAVGLDEKTVSDIRRYVSGDLLHGSTLKSDVLHRRFYNLALIDFWHLAERVLPIIRAAAPWLPVVVDTVDVHFAREEAAEQLGLGEASNVSSNKARELAVYNAADSVLAASREDESILRRAGVSKPIYVVPIIFRVHPRPKVVRKPEVLFVGGFNHAPNEDGLLWFAQECWPIVRRQIPDAILSVVGSNPTPAVSRLAQDPSINVVGQVPEVEPFVDRAAVSIAPLRYGAGMKGKVCEALAGGIPLVTTRVGVQGLPIRDKHEARICDAADEFAGAVIWNLENQEEAERMGAAGQHLVASICSPEVVDATLQSIVSAEAFVPGRFAKLACQSRIFLSRTNSFARSVTVSATDKLGRQLFCK